MEQEASEETSVYFQYVCQWLLAVLSTMKSQIYSQVVGVLLFIHKRNGR